MVVKLDIKQRAQLLTWEVYENHQ
ncbi:hypothetical protein AVEN_66789-1, partial [Araneus ventricosus]